jgi:hypothetical protein
VKTPFTGEFITNQGVQTGQIFLQFNLFALTSPGYGESFWLYLNKDGVYDADTYADSGDGVEGAVWVPWAHILQHTYTHFTDLDIKETHTFWPPGTTEVNVLGYLVDALNNNGSTRLGGDATIVPSSNTEIKTFFLDRPANATDKYTTGQMGDLVDLLRG